MALRQRERRGMVFGRWALPANAKGVFAAAPSDPRRLAIDCDSRVHVHSYGRVLGSYPMGYFRDALVLVGRVAQNHAEQLIFEDFNAPAWTFRSHTEALGILLEKMLRQLRPSPSARR
jgi:hypothetical protein